MHLIMIEKRDMYKAKERTTPKFTTRRDKELGIMGSRVHKRLGLVLFYKPIPPHQEAPKTFNVEYV
jgi:hypothetical protein